jgi:hypothetical protein
MDFEQAKALDLDRVGRHVAELWGKFDAVQIFATRYDPTLDCTVNVAVGAGNWHTRRGQVQEWVIQNDEIARCRAMDMLGEEEEGSE